MILKEFRWNIVLRVTLITALALLLAFVVTSRDWFFTPLVIVILLVITIRSLVYYIEKTNKDLTYFILSIKQSGFTTSFPPGKRGKTFRKLSEAFNDVIEEFRKVNLQRETHYQYLQTLTNNIQAGIFSYDLSGKIELANPAALRLLNVMRLRNTEELKQINAKLYKAIQDLQPGQRQLLRTLIGEQEVRLSIQVKELVMNETPFRVVLIQDLNRELEEQEVEAWQKLIRVLTHEIMNTVTPIVSLTEAVNTLLVEQNGERKDLKQLDEEDKEDLYGSLETIEKRSKGLLRFVNAYKDFTKTPELIFTQIDVLALLKRVINLLGPEFNRTNIVLSAPSFEGHLNAKADAELLEQVIINIFRNAMDALEGRDDPQITVEVARKNMLTTIRIADNGTGMNKDVLDKAFIPFFTTKKNGTGIGLSLSRQIMRMHKGT
ncbi:MAG: ATP-binding protein, partial [Cyclobacteriaceae bacterium]